MNNEITEYAVRRYIRSREVPVPSDEKIEILKEKGGKPYVRFAANGVEPCSISISHSGKITVVATASPRIHLGVDVEYGRDFKPMVKDNFLSAEEGAEMMRLVPGNVKMAETAAWCCKEAYLKATGLGLRQHPLSLRLHSMHISDFIIEGVMTDLRSHRNAVVKAKLYPQYVIAISYYESSAKHP